MAGAMLAGRADAERCWTLVWMQSFGFVSGHDLQSGRKARRRNWASAPAHPAPKCLSSESSGPTKAQRLKRLRENHDDENRVPYGRLTLACKAQIFDAPVTHRI